MGSIPTLLVAQSLDQSGGSKEQREGDDVPALDLNAEIQELGAEVSQSDITDALNSYLEGADLTNATLSSAKKAIHSKLSINKDDYDTKWFKEQFSSMKKMKEEALKDEVVEEVVQELEDGDAEEEDEEEVACKEIEIGGTVYLLSLIHI